MYYSGQVSAYIEQFLFVGAAPVTGTARVPDGTTATLTNVQTGRRITLTDDDDFTIPTGVKALLNKSQLSHSESVQCTGDHHSCEARVSLASGARHRKIVIHLSAPNLALDSTTPIPEDVAEHYVLSGRRYADGAHLTIAGRCPRRTVVWPHAGREEVAVLTRMRETFAGG